MGVGVSHGGLCPSSYRAADGAGRVSPECRVVLADYALDSSHADYFHAAGTTTSVVSTGFGEMEDQGSGAQVEVRASWSLRSSAIGPHLRAWSEFVCMLAGFPPTHEGVATLPPQRATS